MTAAVILWAFTAAMGGAAIWLGLAIRRARRFRAELLRLAQRH